MARGVLTEVEGGGGKEYTASNSQQLPPQTRRGGRKMRRKSTYDVFALALPIVPSSVGKEERVNIIHYHKSTKQQKAAGQRGISSVPVFATPPGQDVRQGLLSHDCTAWVRSSFLLFLSFLRCFLGGTKTPHWT